MTETNNRGRALFYVVSALLALTYTGVIYIACRCYIPYNFTNMLSEGAMKALWTLMILPMAVLPVALLLVNKLYPRLSRLSLLSVLLTSCFTIAIPRLFDFGEASEYAYFTSVTVIFLVSCTVCALVRDIKGERKFGFFANIILSVLLFLVLAGITAVNGYLLAITSHLLSNIILCFFAPVVCLITALDFILDVYSKGTFILMLVSSGFGCLCAGVSVLYSRLPALISFLLSALTLGWMAVDIIKYIIIRRNKNDSKSCNA